MYWEYLVESPKHNSKIFFQVSNFSNQFIQVANNARYMFQITFVSERITVLQAITVMLENTLALPNLHISHKLHNVL